MENENVEKDWLYRFFEWVHDFIEEHPYVTGGFLACQCLCAGIGMLLNSFAWYLVCIGICGAILALLASEG